MLVELKGTLRTLLLPPAGPLLLACVGIWLTRARTPQARRAGCALLIAGLAALWLLATPWVADLLGGWAQRVPPLDLRRPPDAQAIVILGGGKINPHAQEYGGAPAAGIGSLERLAYGAWVARRTGLPIEVSGTPEETLAMSTSLAREFGVPVRWVEARSRDTFQNAYYSARLLQPQGVRRIVLVTDSDHEWRALQEFTSAGFVVRAAPTGVWVWQGEGSVVRRYLPDAMALARSSAALYELMGDNVRQLLSALQLRRQ